MTWPAPSQATPNQEQVELAGDHEDSELAPISVDFHWRSASASGLMAMAEHISTKNEWRSSCSAMVKACLRWKVISCSGLHASLPLNLEIATRLIEEEILEEGNNSLFSEKDRTFSLT